MTQRTDAPGDADDQAETDAAAGRRGSGRDIDIAGRNLLALARMAAASGDAGAARAYATGALGSGDPAVAGEAANLFGAADAIAEVTTPRLRRRRRP